MKRLCALCVLSLGLLAAGCRTDKPDAPTPPPEGPGYNIDLTGPHDNGDGLRE